ESGGLVVHAQQTRRASGARGRATSARSVDGAPQTSQSGGGSRSIAPQQRPQRGSRRPAPSAASQTGHRAGKTRSSAATAQPASIAARGLHADRAKRVPALAVRAAVLPGRRRRRAHVASVRPVERVAELQRAAIFLEGLAGLAAPLEDRAEER